MATTTSPRFLRVSAMATPVLPRPTTTVCPFTLPSIFINLLYLMISRSFPSATRYAIWEATYTKKPVRKMIIPMKTSLDMSIIPT